MKDFIINHKTICKKIPIQITDELRAFYFKNINLRRSIWNEFIDEISPYCGRFNMYDNINLHVLNILLKAYKAWELSIHRYDEYCVGISEQVKKDIMHGIKTVRTQNKKYLNGDHHNTGLAKLKYRKRDNCRGSFAVHTLVSIDKRDIPAKGTVYSRIHIMDEKTIKFRVRGCNNGHDSKYIYLDLLESLYDDKISHKHNNEYVTRYVENKFLKHEYRFRDSDIKEIGFIHELGKFYIQLSIDVTYIINGNTVLSRVGTKAGIDTGIRTPFVIYNGHDFIEARFSQKVSNKLHYLERRARRLQSYMDKKYHINVKRVQNGELESIHTKNYEKLRYKYRKIWRRIINIRKFWHYQIAKRIVTTYQTIVVDTFTQPTWVDDRASGLPRKLLQQINYANRFHGMFNANEVLKYMACKYGCNYINAPKYTTSTCSRCGHKNPHIPLGCTTLNCEKCGLTIDRDFNAAKNCYVYA